MGESSAGAKGVHGSVQAPHLGLVKPLLLTPEGTRPPTANLDHDEHRRRSWVEGDDVELVTTHAHLPSEDRPSLAPQLVGHGTLGVVA